VPNPRCGTVPVEVPYTGTSDGACD
jgi:hypothetical protein